MVLIKRIQNVMMAALLVIVLFASGFHTSSDAHSDKYSHESCSICFAIQAVQNTTIAGPLDVPVPVVIETIPEIFFRWPAPVVSRVLSVNSPPTGPPV
jgi:hypothetical protein